MEIRTLNIDQLVPADYNPRKKLKPGDAEYEKLKRSLQEFGYVDPVIWNERTGHVIGGHQRLQVLIDSGETEVQVSVVELDEDREKALNIALNKISGEWDMNALADLLEELKRTDLDLALTGFDADEVDELFRKMQTTDEVKEDDFNVDAAVASITEPVSKPRDIWQLGRHRLMCGDSTDKATVETLMDGNKADMVFTDPPYLMGFTGNVHADGSKSFNAKHGAIKNDKMSREDGDKFILDIFTNIKLFNKGSYYVCFYRLGLDYIFRALDKLENQYKALIIWNKGNHTLSNSDYMSKYEPIVYGWFENHLFYGDRSNFDIWDIQRTQKNDLHPTMKPIELCCKAIENSSKRKDIVLDLFGGSGTTLIACEQLNRICYMMELDEKYCDVIVSRWETLTGQKAELIS